MPTGSSKISGFIGLALEKWGPVVISAVVTCALIVMKVKMLSLVAESKIQPSNLYSAVFNWSAVQVGFSFGVYGFLLTKSDGFVGAVRKSVAMKRFTAYVRRGTVGGFLLTIASIPVTVASPSPGSSDFTYYALSFWFGLFIWTFLAFIRIAFIFGRLASVPDQEPFIGA